MLAPIPPLSQPTIWQPVDRVVYTIFAEGILFPTKYVNDRNKRGRYYIKAWAHDIFKLTVFAIVATGKPIISVNGHNLEAPYTLGDIHVLYPATTRNNLIAIRMIGFHIYI